MQLLYKCGQHHFSDTVKEEQNIQELATKIYTTQSGTDQMSQVTTETDSNQQSGTGPNICKERTEISGD